MATATVDIGSLIARSPEVRGGRPRLAGTGVTVQRIVGWYKLGLSPEEIASEIGHLSMAQIHAALAYYHANRAEIDAAIAEDEAAGDEAEAEWYRARPGQSARVQDWGPDAPYLALVQRKVSGRDAQSDRILERLGVKVSPE